MDDVLQWEKDVDKLIFLTDMNKLLTSLEQLILEEAIDETL